MQKGSRGFGAYSEALPVPGARRLGRRSPAYPSRLKDLKKRAPKQVFVMGELPDSGSPTVAVVGTRYADRDAIRFTEELCERLAAAGVVIVSGGAFGVDAAAHRGALAGGGVTLAVFAGGLGFRGPRRHLPLFERILRSGGALVSELQHTEPPYPTRFVDRNRVVAAWADATVVVQAPARSGALSTAEEARALGRRLFAVPNAPWDGRSAGSNRLLEHHASACLGADSVLRALDLDLGGQLGIAGAVHSELSGEKAEIFSVLGPRPRHVDEIAAAANLGPAKASTLLLEMLLEGRVEMRGVGLYVRADRDRS